MIKSPDAFRTISEAAEDLGLPQHVLRFWETRFPQIKPMKRGGGRRYYRPEDIELLRGIQHLLYNEGYTIRGVKRILKENGNRYVIAVGKGENLEVLNVDQPQEQLDSHENPVEEPLRGERKQAVSVSEIIENEKKSTKSIGLFKPFIGKKTKIQKNEVALNLSVDEREALQETLYNLLECKRLLDQSR